MAETTRLHYKVTGPDGAPALLFLHGFMGSLEDWGPIVRSVSARYRCLCLDLPGHGVTGPTSDPEAYTMEGAARAVVRILDSVAVEACTVIGYSMGGRLALYLGIHEPARCAALVLESASPGIEDEPARTRRQVLDQSWARHLVEEDFDSFLISWYQQPLFESLQKQPALFQEILARRKRNNPAALAKSLLGMSPGVQPSLWDKLHGLGTPLLVLAGELDLRYIEIARQTAARVRGAQWALVPRAGHNAHAENPGAFENLLGRFLAGRERLSHGKH